MPSPATGAKASTALPTESSLSSSAGRRGRGQERVLTLLETCRVSGPETPEAARASGVARRPLAARATRNRRRACIGLVIECETNQGLSVDKGKAGPDAGGVYGPDASQSAGVTKLLQMQPFARRRRPP